MFYDYEKQLARENMAYEKGFSHGYLKGMEIANKVLTNIELYKTRPLATVEYNSLPEELKLKVKECIEEGRVKES